MSNKFFRQLFGILLVFAVFSSSMAGVNAEEKAQENVQEKAEEKPEQKETEYHLPTFANFAQTFWRFSKFDINDDDAVDKFMLINECDIYNEFYHNEFEWSGIRDATRNFLTENEKKFPVHYQFMKKISLGSYDFEKKGFVLSPEYSLNGIKRFEIPSDKLNEEVCGRRTLIEGYPKVIQLELSRPVVFDFLPLEEEIASQLIHEKMQGFEDLDQRRRTQGAYEKNRYVYFNVKVKIFALRSGEDQKSQHGYRSARLLGILEGIEVFADREKQNLVYFKDFRRKKRKKPSED